MSSETIKQAETSVLNYYHYFDSDTVAERTSVRLSWNFDGIPKEDELVFLGFRNATETVFKLKKNSLVDLCVWILKKLQGETLSDTQRADIRDALESTIEQTLEEL